MSSPVIGPDGTIHIGNVNGDIIGINPDGSEKWRVTTPFRIYSSPAVADDGTVYAIGTSYFANASFPDHKCRSVLLTIGPDGTAQKLTLFPDQGFTAGSPKLSFDGRRTWALLHAYTRSAELNASAVLAFDNDGNFVTRQNLGCQFHVEGQGDSFLDDLLDALSVDFDRSAPPLPPDQYGWIDPTVAIVERRDLFGEGKVLVVAADQRCSNITGVIWEPPRLSRLWQVDEGDTFKARSSPAAVNGGQLIVSARDDGMIIARTPLIGQELWKHDSGSVVLRGTPASLGGLVYYCTNSKIRSLDSANGETSCVRPSGIERARR
jgi:outer membrane protein assembly factor BamB